jgi:PAS domain S-box-containing protein
MSRKSDFIPSELLYEAIVDSSDDAIITKNLQSIVMSWNKSAERIFGYSAEEMVGQSIAKLFPPGRLDEEAQILARLQQGERVDHFETQRQRKDGNLIDVS